MHLWDLVMPEAERQLLLLRQSNTNPKVIAYAYLYGHHNYNAKPFLPITIEMLVHRKKTVKARPSPNTA